MQPEILGSPTNDDWADAFSPLRELPSAGQRWTVRRKAALIRAVRGGWVAMGEACQRYNLSVDEFAAWERDLGRKVSPVSGPRDIRSTATPKRAAGIAYDPRPYPDRETCLVDVGSRRDRGCLATPRFRCRGTSVGVPARYGLYFGDRGRRGGSVAQSRRRAGVRSLVGCPRYRRPGRGRGIGASTPAEALAPPFPQAGGELLNSPAAMGAYRDTGKEMIKVCGPEGARTQCVIFLMRLAGPGA